MTTISKSMDIAAPLSEVFTYFARPEHMADQFPENMGLNVIPLEVKNGFGVGTIFRISGDFDGKKLEWDCETIDYIPHKKIVAKMIEGPFKHWQITVDFDELEEKKTKTTLTVVYDMPMGPLGGLIDKVKLKKIAERGMENGLYRVKALLEGTGSIPVYITLEAYRKVLKEKERLKCSVSEAIVDIINQNEQQATATAKPIQ
ncbi:MAG TPA: SRPBCC family protein [Candidatus Nitrosocosmicus sp.]|jgi:ligand-binding SRPBCC domain-containing protein|nr:SRPBCC family protein [Candidatus Nitrosocosmicus sp.]